MKCNCFVGSVVIAIITAIKRGHGADLGDDT